MIAVCCYSVNVILSSSACGSAAGFILHGINLSVNGSLRLVLLLLTLHFLTLDSNFCVPRNLGFRKPFLESFSIFFHPLSLWSASKVLTQRPNSVAHLFPSLPHMLVLRFSLGSAYLSSKPHLLYTCWFCFLHFDCIVSCCHLLHYL